MPKYKNKTNRDGRAVRPKEYLVGVFLLQPTRTSKLFSYLLPHPATIRIPSTVFIQILRIRRVRFVTNFAARLGYNAFGHTCSRLFANTEETEVFALTMPGEKKKSSNTHTNTHIYGRSSFLSEKYRYMPQRGGGACSLCAPDSAGAGKFVDFSHLSPKPGCGDDGEQLAGPTSWPRT